MSEEQTTKLAAAVMSFCVRVFVGHDGYELPSWCVRASDKGGTKRCDMSGIRYMELQSLLHYSCSVGYKSSGYMYLNVQGPAICSSMRQPPLLSLLPKVFRVETSKSSHYSTKWIPCMEATKSAPPSPRLPIRRHLIL